jgi:hypothetical protein
VFGPVKAVADSGGAGATEKELIRLIRKASDAIEILVLAYDKAENPDVQPEKFDQRRTNWGMYTRSDLVEVIVIEAGELAPSTSLGSSARVTVVVGSRRQYQGAPR